MQLRSVRPLFSLAALVALALPSLSQTATLHDGTVLTLKQPLELFLTEGPVWDLDVAARRLDVTGRLVTIPAAINGVPFGIVGTAVTDANGVAQGGINAANFDRLADANAVGRDAHALLGGAARPLFSTAEARRTDASAPASRNATAQAAIEARYFDYVRSAYPFHAAVLPADFLDRAGVRGVDSSTWVYPSVAGSTLKSQGHTYLDSLGREYLIPDVESSLEHAENISIGRIRSAHPGNATVPPSFVIGNMLYIMNQDPRFPAHILSLTATELPRATFFSMAVGNEVTVTGHAVGEYVLFAQDVETAMVDPAAPVTVTADAWFFKNSGNEIRVRGTVSQPTGIALQVRIGTRVWNVATVIDPVTGLGTYDFRTKGEINVAAVTTVTIEARQTNSIAGAAPAFTQTFLRAQLP